jgi:hypothetical protein
MSLDFIGCLEENTSRTPEFYRHGGPWIALASPQTSIAELRRWLEREEARGRPAGAVLPFGVAELDGRLPVATLRHIAAAAGSACCGDAN